MAAREQSPLAAAVRAEQSEETGGSPAEHGREQISYQVWLVQRLGDASNLSGLQKTMLYLLAIIFTVGTDMLLLSK